MKSALLVIAQDVFRDEEYARPLSVLSGGGVAVTTASVAAGPATGKLGMRAIADIALSDAVSSQWDAVVFIGGAGAQVYFDDPVAHSLASDTLNRGAILAAICIAPSILARAGVLKGIRVTAFATQREDLESDGAVWIDDPVVVDGQIITGNGPDAAEHFGREILRALHA